MYLLRRDTLWNSVKPYELKFDTAEIPKTNAVPEKCEGLEVEDIRGREKEFSLEKNGFAVINISPVSMKDFQTPQSECLTDAYFKPLAETLKEFLGAERIRKSHPQFPISTGESYDFQQPSLYYTSVRRKSFQKPAKEINRRADTTPTFTKTLVAQLNPDTVAEFQHKRHQYVNIWKPLKGPVSSWPLAICDNSSVDAARDLQARDIVYPEGPVESFWVHPSSGFRFYYLSNQNTDEGLVMLQSDSNGHTGVPHTAFPNPWAADDMEGRESVEVRALVFYAEDARD
ncbi:hypothetical protein CC80DRAFT_546755 [Byssothecium circinans]|uniref:Methyltransferase n=1 Tax=Byssothecium circinans TaxID=147558 RepID=A0A6A5U059_9PLEO|nr:hypothetical protein CC80DRAFT_546755 [Byssothecium circinans]